MVERLTADCDSAAAPAESVGVRASCETGPSRQASQGETPGCCRILGAPLLVPVVSYG